MVKSGYKNRQLMLQKEIFADFFEISTKPIIQYWQSVQALKVKMVVYIVTIGL